MVIKLNFKFILKMFGSFVKIHVVSRMFSGLKKFKILKNVKYFILVCIFLHLFICCIVGRSMEVNL